MLRQISIHSNITLTTIGININTSFKPTCKFNNPPTYLRTDFPSYSHLHTLFISASSPLTPHPPPLHSLCSHTFSLLTHALHLPFFTPSLFISLCSFLFIHFSLFISLFISPSDTHVVRSFSATALNPSTPTLDLTALCSSCCTPHSPHTRWRCDGDTHTKGEETGIRISTRDRSGRWRYTHMSTRDRSERWRHTTTFMRGRSER